MIVVPFDARRSRYIPWLFVAAFAVIVAVNGTMMWLAIDSFSGLYVQKARDRGVHYNDVLAQQRDRDALGWRIETAWQPGADRFSLSVFDANGVPLTDAHVTVELVRPAAKGRSLAIELAPTAPGAFAGHVDLPGRGNWDADIVVDRDGRHFALTRRLFLK